MKFPLSCLRNILHQSRSTTGPPSLLDQRQRVSTVWQDDGGLLRDVLVQQGAKGRGGLLGSVMKSSLTSLPLQQVSFTNANNPVVGPITLPCSGTGSMGAWDASR